MHEYIEQFRMAIERSGLTPPAVVEPDGKLHRFSSNGERGDDAGWYVFHGDGVPAGAFGDWRTGTWQTWQADIGRPPSSDEDAKRRERLVATRRERKREAARRMLAASARATAIWKASRPAPDDHLYLLKKGVKAHGLRVHKGELVVPMLDGTDLQSLQFIAADGSKRFLAEGRVKGCYFVIGQPNGVLCIAEGYATAASIHEATGHAVAVAFNAGNLSPVVDSLRERFPDVGLIVCADDDTETKGNPGLTKAKEAARAVDAKLAVPDFEAQRPAGVTDFNDMHRHLGLDAVRACLARATSARSDQVTPVILRKLSDVVARPIRWLWPGRLARGKVSMIAGHPGLGKSQVTSSLAAIVTTGGYWPVDGGQCELGSVFLLSAEDDAADTIKPRLLAAGADTDRCYVVDAVPHIGAHGAVQTRTFSLQTDLPRLASSLEQIGDVALVVIDPISAYLGATDSHKNADVRALLAPLSELAARYCVAVVCVSHLNKSGGSEALTRVTGSMAFVATARAAYVVTRDKDDSQRRLFLPLKNNLGNDQAGLAFVVRGSELEGGIQTSRVIWEQEPVTVTADEAMQNAGLEDAEPSHREEIAAWLLDLLSTTRLNSQEVQSEAKRAGFAWRSVHRAAKEAGVLMKREGFGRDTMTYWSLAPLVPTGPTPATADKVA